MITKNSIQHLLNHEGLRITVADVTDAAKEAGNIHNLSLFSEIIISKILAATAALATDFKNHEGISLKWVTHSPLGIIRADAYEGHYVRGFIENPEAEAFDKYDPAEEKRLVCENAQLFVTRYSLLKQPYISTVNASCNSISECLTSYLNESDQTDSYLDIQFQLGEDGKLERVACFLAQMTPQANKKLYDDLFILNSKGWKIFGDKEDASSLSFLIDKEGFLPIGESVIKFQCTCNLDHIRNSLLLLPETERNELLEDEVTEVCCHYCGKKYNIPRSTLVKWFNDEKGEGIQ